MTTICIVRHGQTDRNKAKIIQGRGDFELNAEGIKQAHETGFYFKQMNEHFDYIFSSPLIRAFDTAKYIAGELGYQGEVIKIPAFIEREFGKADGADIEPKIYELINADKIEGIEHVKDIQKRMVEACIKLNQQYPNKRILVVSHSHAIKGLLTALDNNRSFNDNLYNCAINYFLVDEKNKISIDRVNIKPTI